MRERGHGGLGCGPWVSQRPPLLLISAMRRGSAPPRRAAGRAAHRPTDAAAACAGQRAGRSSIDGVQQVPTGVLAAAAGLGTHPTVLVHLGMSLALVTAVLAHRRVSRLSSPLPKVL